MDSLFASFRVSFRAREALLLALVAATALILPGSGARAQSVHAGFVALNREDYATARENFLPLAQQGDSIAQYDMGILYLNGYGVSKNFVTARTWFRKAADQGDKDAQLRLSEIYDQGLGVAKDRDEARKWREKATGQEDRPSDKDLAAMIGVMTGPINDTEEDEIPKECITVSSRKGWQEHHFSGGLLDWATVSGSWSVDNEKYAHVGPKGYSGADAKALDKFATYKVRQSLPFGTLLVRNGEYFISWRSFFNHVRRERPTKMPPTVLGFRINDTTLDDNHGSLTVCLKYTKPKK